MSFMDANDPLSPFHDPHRHETDPEPAPAWPSVPYSAADPPPDLVTPVRAPQPLSPAPTSSLDGNGPSTGPWGREPQIYGQPDPGLISPRETTASNGTNLEKQEPYLRVRITALDRNRRDILIRFDAQTNLSNFTGSTYRNISRSYVEFQRFYDQIVYSNPQTIIPALPLAQTSAPSDEEDDRLVKVMLQRWFTRVCEDPILLTDEELRSFIESDFGYQPMPRPKRKASSGFSLLSRRPPDEDEQLAQARFELTKLETQYIEAAKAVDKLSQTRKAISFSHADMGNKLVDVAATEVHAPLASAVRKMGRSWHIYADIDAAQEISDRVILGDSLGYQGLNARSAKETLLQRSLVLEEYQEAVKNTINKRRNIERLKASSNIRPERVDEALEELEEANKIEQLIHRRVEGISQNLHRALHRHSRLAHEDITAALIEHARTNILYEKQFLRELESLMPDMRVAADPAPPPSSLPAAAAIAPLAALNRSATMPPGAETSRTTISSGHFMPPSISTQSPLAKSASMPGPEPIATPSPTAFIPPTQVVSSGVPQTPTSATSPVPPRDRTTSVPSFPRTSQFVSQPVDGAASPALTPGFPKTSQFVSASPARPNVPPTGATPSQTPVTPGFPRTNQFTTPTPATPSVTPGFPKTNQFTSNPGPTPNQTPVTPGFPKTSQFVGVSSPLTPSGGAMSPAAAATGGYSSYPRTSQFLPGAAPGPLSSPGYYAVNGGGIDGRQPDGPPAPSSGYNSANGPGTPTRARSPLGQAPQPGLAQPPYQQPALPSQIHQQQLQQQRQQNVDPLGSDSRIISSQPMPSSPPMLRPQQPSLSASIASLPPRSASQGPGSSVAGDPLLGGGGLSQSMFVTPTTPNGPLGGGLETGPLGGTIRGTLSGRGTPTKRLDAREAASKLANFL